MNGKKREGEGRERLVIELLTIKTPEWYNAMEMKDAIIDSARRDALEIHVWGPDLNNGLWEIIIFSLREVK